MRTFIVMIALFITSCDTLYNVSRTDSFFNPSIGKAVCAKKHLVITHWNEGSVRYPKLEQYMLDLNSSRYLSQEDFENNTTRDLSSRDSFINEYISIPEGTRMTIDKVYKSNVFAVRSHYIVMSTVQISALEGKLVDISSLFEPIDGSGLGLSQQDAEYCN